jgi:ankyrin repeat protein
MKHLLLTTIAAVLVVGCSDPEAEANKLFTEASQLVRDADAISEPYSLEAYNKRKAAVELLEKIPLQYPQSSLSVKISEGDFKIQSQSIDEIRGKMKPDISIHDAVKKGNIEAVKQHLAAGADVNAKEVGDKWTPLHYAAEEGHKEIVELLIAEGADVNATTDTGDTPLDLAIQSILFPEGHPETADLLRKHGGKTGEELKAAGN